MKSAIVLAALFSGSVFAVGIGNDNPGGGGTQTQNVNSYTHSSAQASASARATGVGLGVGVGLGGAGGTGGSAVSNSAGGAGGMGGSATGGSATGGVATSSSAGGKAVATSGSSTATGGNPVGNGGASSVTYNEAAAQQRGTVTIKNTPEVTLSNIAPTSPCMGGTSVGGSGPGFSIGIGTTWKDGDCSLRETARSFAGLGLTDDAIAILCSSEYAAAAPSCKALKKD